MPRKPGNISPEGSGRGSMPLGSSSQGARAAANQRAGASRAVPKPKPMPRPVSTSTSFSSDSRAVNRLLGKVTQREIDLENGYFRFDRIIKPTDRYFRSPSIKKAK